MLTALRQRADREDEGFTLIELMVVVLIIAILLAIAIPTFLGARNSANSRAAQSDLRNALTAEQTYWTNNQSWDTATFSKAAGDVDATETSLQWLNTGPVTPGNSVLVTADSTNNGVILTAAGKDGHCYSIEAIDQPAGAATAPAGTYYYESKTVSMTVTQTTDPSTGAVVSSSGGCSAPAAVPASGGASGSAASAANLGTNWASSF